jgi:hypothetical protein
MNVSDAVKKAYREDTIHKNLIIRIPSLNMVISNDRIWSESMSLKESLMTGNNFEFVGCVASQFSVIINGIPDKVVGKYIEVAIKTDDTEEIPLFHGYVDSCEKQTNRTFKKIVAYDALCKKGKKNMLEWYKALAFPINIYSLRTELFSELGIEQEETSLLNDTVSITEKYLPQTLSALDMIKAICQLNGVCGIINRDGKFEYRTISTQSETDVYGAFPGILVPNGEYSYPGYYTKPTSRAADASQTEVIGYYKSVDYQDYVVKPIDSIKIRKSANEEGIKAGVGDNTYVIQANMFTYNMSDETKLNVAQNILKNVKDIEFVPFESNTNGLPYIECGKDTVKCYVLNDEGTDYEPKTFSVLNREIKGIQSLRDVYSADAEEVQKEFPQDVNTQIESTVQSINTNIGTTVEQEFSNKIVSVPSLPADWKMGVVYLIQGEVVVN